LALNDNIRILRENMSLQQTEVAEALDVSTERVYRWESGEWEPTEEQLSKLAELFNVTTAELLSAAPPKRKAAAERTQPTEEQGGGLRYVTPPVPRDEYDSQGQKRTPLNGLFALASIFAMPFAMGILLRSGLNGAPAMLGNMKYLAVFALIPLGAIIWASVMKRRGYRTTLCMVVGVLCLIPMLLISAIFGSAGKYAVDADEYIASVEQTVQFDIPTTASSFAMRVTGETDDAGYLSYCCASFSGLTGNSFEKTVERSEKWIEDDNAETMAQIIPTYFAALGGDEMLIYNKTLGAYNELPQAAGDYDMLFMSFNDDANVLIIVEYRVKVS